MISSSQVEAIELPPLKEDTQESEALEREILRLFKEEIYYPLLAELNINKKTVQNSKNDLIMAIKSGRISYSRGSFTGRFSASVSRELKLMGAQWDRKQGAWKIPRPSLSMNIRMAIRQSETAFAEKLADIDKKLAQILPDQLASKLKTQKIFDTMLHRVNKSFAASVKSITVDPTLSSYQIQKLNDEWRNNLELSIKDFTTKEVESLRSKMQKSYFQGMRPETIVKDIQKSFGVSANKAKFLARQETRLITSKFKEAKYTEANVKYYKWVCVAGSPNHPVRPQHKKLGDMSKSGTLFRWDDPPVVSADGEPVRHGNPGQDFNCVPGLTTVNFDFGLNKAFRRFYTGEMTKMVMSDGRTLNMTPNHPVLTQKGWIAAQHVQLGDNLFSTQYESFFASEMKTNNIEASAQNVFNALSLFGQVFSQAGSKSNFHGDGIIDQEIDTISINRELIFDVLIDAFEQVGKFVFKGSDSMNFDLCSSNSALFVRSFGVDQSYSGILCEIGSFIFAEFTHAYEVGFGPISDLQTSFSEFVSKTAARDTILSRDFKYTNPALIIIKSIFRDFNSIDSNQALSFNFDIAGSEISRQCINVNAEHLSDLVQRNSLVGVNRNTVVDKSSVDFFGHVYNFETPMNWFIAENQIIHNCRCYAIPVIVRKKTE